jgi:F0F1-type ATP synthase membrane subunit a
MYSLLKSKNSSSVILPAIISITIMVVVIYTGYKFKNRKMILIPRKIQNRMKQLFTSHKSLRARK